MRALPPTTRLRQVFVLEDGTAYLDFSPELRQGIGGGSEEEILAVYSIVNSVAINIPEIRRVGILINGRPVPTLNGHLDLRRPLRPDFKLILGSTIVREDGAARAPVRLALAE
jgi:spore germination protein GerM